MGSPRCRAGGGRSVSLLRVAGGGSPGRKWPERPGGSLQQIGEFGGPKYFFRGRNVHQGYNTEFVSNSFCNNFGLNGMGNMGSICRFSCALSAGIREHCSQVLVCTSISGPQKGVGKSKNAIFWITASLLWAARLVTKSCSGQLGGPERKKTTITRSKITKRTRTRRDKYEQQLHTKQQETQNNNKLKTEKKTNDNQRRKPT